MYISVIDTASEIHVFKCELKRELLNNLEAHLKNLRISHNYMTKAHKHKKFHLLLHALADSLSYIHTLLYSKSDFPMGNLNQFPKESQVQMVMLLNQNILLNTGGDFTEFCQGSFFSPFFSAGMGSLKGIPSKDSSRPENVESISLFGIRTVVPSILML